MKKRPPNRELQYPPKKKKDDRTLEDILKELEKDWGESKTNNNFNNNKK